MDEVRGFLESSTIHGVGYISSSRRVVRLFWVLIVLGGFSGATVLIYHSFKDWKENPIKTTIETLPISEVTLPKVTVCPPKNTYTNLNFDMMLTELMTLDKDKRNELTQYAVGLIQDHVYNDVMTNISLLEEENRYYNWYMGHTSIRLPYWGKRKCNEKKSFGRLECKKSRLRYFINTNATSGKIKTKYFGDPFQSDKVTKDFKYFLYIHTSKKYQHNKSISLNIEVENLFLSGFDRLYVGSKSHSDGNITFTKKHSPPKSERYVSLERRISMEEISELEITSMPGVNIQWYYNADFVNLVSGNDARWNSHSIFKR